MKAFLQCVICLRRLAVILGVVAACVLVWVFGHWLFGPAMAPAGPRLLAILAILLLWLGIEAVLFWRQRRANTRLLEGLQKASATVPGEDNELADLREHLDEAFDFLRSQQIGRGASHDFAYALPWYLLVGPPESGKSSLVTHSNLRMPVGERLQRRGIQTRHNGHSTHWWFTDEALLISAAGRLVQGGGQQDAWRGLLSFLMRHRPRRPLDGILVVVGADTLLDGRAAGMAAELRLRLQEAMRAFSTRLQVYVVVSKCDRLTGFQEFFSALDAEVRMQPLGAALPAVRDQAAGDIEARLRQRLAASLEAITRLLPFHAAAERDVARRARMTGLPEQLAVVSEAALAFTRELADNGRYDRHMLLRGVFLTASEAPAAADEALVDGWDARFAKPIGLKVAAARQRAPTLAGRDPRSFFVTGLFRDIIFPQAGLAGRNPKAERRTALIYGSGYVVCLLALLASGLLWLEEFTNHQATLGKFRQGVVAEQALAPSATARNGIQAVLPMLDQARALMRLGGNDTSSERSIGVSPLGIASARLAATRGYDNLLLTRLLPALLDRLTQQLRQAAASGADAGTLRPLLTVYLMLGDPAHYNRQAVATWGSELIGATFALDPNRKAAALGHLQQLLSLLPAPVVLNQQLIEDARALLHQSPDADLIYARLKEESLRSGAAIPLDVVGSLGAAGAQLLMLRSQAGLPVVVPALYTRAGFYQVFLKQAPVLARNADANDWIMGPNGGGNPAEARAVLQQVTNDYVQDYIKQWQAVLAQMSLRALPDLTSLVGGLQTLSGPDSPLIHFIQLVETQTDLGVPPPPSLLGKAASAAGAAAGKLAHMAAAQLPPQSTNPLGLADWPGNAIRAPFAALQALVSASNGQAPVLRVQDTLVAAYGVVSGIASAQDPGVAAQQATARVISAQGADPLIGLRVQAATLPRPIDGIFRELYQNIWGTLLRMTRDRIQANWARDVAPVCEQAIARRYPFVIGGGQFANSDVTLRDFSNFFGPKGVMDNFVADNLAAFTTPGPNGGLTLSSQNGLSLGLSRDGLDQINRARRFRDLFFGTDGNLSVRFSITPTYLDPRALSATLAMDQTQFVYRHQPPRPTQFEWPPVNASGSVSLTITTVDGQTLETQASGPWAIFRLLDKARKSSRSGRDQLQLAFTLDGVQVGFALRASSVVNPISSSDFAEFRCVPRL